MRFCTGDSLLDVRFRAQECRGDFPDIEAAVTNIAATTRVGTEQYNVSLENLPGYIQHVIENRKVAALTDMTAKCDLPLSPALVVPTTTTGK